MGSVLLTSEDIDAPVLQSNVQGSLITLLKAVLVDGYGTTDPLGWEVVFEDVATNTIVFRQLIGDSIRPFIRIDDGIADGRYAYVSIYESMSDINNGSSQMPPYTDQTYRYLLKGNYADATVIPWKVIGDERGFWWLPQCWPLSTDSYDCYWMNHYLGEFACNYVENKYNFMAMLQRSDFTPYNYFDQNTTYCMRNPVTQDIGPYTVAMRAWLASTRVGVYYDGTNPQQVSGRNIYDKIVVEKDTNFLIGTFPVLHMIYEPDSHTYVLSLAERQPLTDVISDTQSILTLCSRYATSAPTSYVQRFSYVIGEGFRNAG